MKRVHSISFDSASNYILNNARQLEKYLFENTFIKPCEDKIIRTLALYQNDDGGYGNALEPDFRLPTSTAQATLYALRILDKLNASESTQEQMVKALHYLKDSYQETLKGWESVTKEVDMYPHASWWSYKVNPVKYNGNPSIELIGYIMKYCENDWIAEFETIALEYIDVFCNKDEIEFHEMLNYMQFYQSMNEKSLKKKCPNMTDIIQKDFKAKLLVLYEKTVNLNIEQWNQYVPYPVKFIEYIDDNILAISDE